MKRQSMKQALICQKKIKSKYLTNEQQNDRFLQAVNSPSLLSQDVIACALREFGSSKVMGNKDDASLHV